MSDDKMYWTTLEQLEGTEDYLKAREEEFRAKPFEDMEEGGGVKASRRDVIKATGAAAIFLGATGCNPERRLIPYHDQPEETIPGNPVFYSSIDADGEHGLIVTTTEGRPIRLDGNPDHPVSRGKLDAVGNASVLDLYDPDRLRQAVRLGEGNPEVVEKVDDLLVEIGAALKAAGPRGVLVTKPVHGVGQEALMNEVLEAFPGVRHVEISSEIGLEKVRASQKACYGSRDLPNHRYDLSDLTVSLGFDFLSEAPNRSEASALAAKARKYKKDGSMGRLVSFEPNLSMTGGFGDERHRVQPQALPEIALALATELQGMGLTVPGVKLSTSSAEVEKKWGIKEGTLHNLALELSKLKKKSLVVAGGSTVQMAQGDALLNTVNLINTMLENDGTTVTYGKAALNTWNESESGWQGLLADAAAGRIQTLVIADVNLAYVLPTKVDVAGAFSKIPQKFGLFTHLHETALLCQAVLPLHHFLESWSDGEPRHGAHVLGQPVIQPLWETRSRQDYLMGIAGIQGNWATFLKNTWKAKVYNSALFAADFETFWKGALRKGIVDVLEADREAPQAPRPFIPSAIQGVTVEAPKGFQLLVHRTCLHGSGDSMNNAWLLETPDPISKITWDNYAAFSLGTAKKHDLQEGEYVLLKTSAGEVEAPVHIQPGLADDVIAVAMGWGRGPEAGQVAAGPSGTGVGFNAARLAEVDGDLVLCGLPVQWERVAKKTELACVQGHQYLENSRIRATGEGKRKILQDAYLEEFNEEGNEDWKISYHMPTDISLWRQQFKDATTHKWGMVIDTNACNGCGACIVSCQAENNISVVGKDEVLLNREMHWIRIDRYYTAADDNHPEETDEVDLVQQPMLCQHCDNAPCETVCPVVATTHNEEGLNVQTYNRCVGTRYCSNNCPYKVRHYNWYDYSDYRAGLHQSGRPLTRFLRQIGLMGDELKDKTEFPLMMQFNPDVTVRSRGVMEKCTFCIHKIRRWHDQERKLGRDLPESAKQSACESACPTSAISFGNMLDEDSKVSTEMDSKGAYKVLMEVNAQPNITYLTRLKNRPMPPKSTSESKHH